MKKFSRRARIATGGVVLAAVAAGTFGAVSAGASAPTAAQARPAAVQSSDTSPPRICR